MVLKLYNEYTLVEDRIIRKVAFEGFESIGITEEYFDYLLNEKHGLNVRKEDIRKLKDMRDIDRLPISFDEKFMINREIYDKGRNYVDNSKELTSKDFIDDVKVIRREKKEREEKKRIKKGLCPKCKKRLGKHINGNYCIYCGFKLQK